MSKRTNTSRTKFGSMLKFSNTSVTSARASRARNSIDLTGDSSSSSNGLIGKRKRFFNSSTELYHILALMLMSFCRQVTNVAYVRRRLLAYSSIVFIGGFLHDFAPTLVRAFIIQISRSHLFNWLFVKYGWAWNVTLLLPLITLSSHALQSLSEIELDAVEKSIEQYHERRLKQLLIIQQQQQSNHVQHRTSISTNNLQPNPKVISLQAISSMSPTRMIEQYQKQILDSDPSMNKCRTNFLRHIIETLKIVFNVRDIARLIVCTLFYMASIACFGSIGKLTSSKTMNKSLNDKVGHAVATQTIQMGIDPSTTTTTGMDISGHIFILIFSNLIFFEECNIMSGWEPLVDRLFDLSREYMYLEMDSLFGPLSSTLSSGGGGEWTSTRSLVFGWKRLNDYSYKLRIIFALCTILTILWDFMILQTAFFYHSLIEKLIAMIWAFACWFIVYRIVFPLLSLDVKRPLPIGSNEN